MTGGLRVSLNLESHTPAYRQIANDLRRHLVEGRLKPGDLLPPVRQLAVDLGVHFNTVALAYRMLADEGWLELKRRRGAAVIARLEAMELPERRPLLRAKHAEVLGYLRNNVSRMDYPTYLAKGWLIGSGAVESACKTVVAQRLKLAGMRWREPGTDAVCHLRALYKSERSQWELFWRRKVN